MYRLTLSEGEYESLAYAAGRYESARVLYAALDGDDTFAEGDTVFTLSEPDAWAYREALAEEDGDLIVPPLIGGSLAERLISLFESIV